MSTAAVRCNHGVNESTVCSINKKEHNISRSIKASNPSSAKICVSHQDSFPKQTEMALCVGLDDEDVSCHGTIKEGAYDKEIRDHCLLQQVL